MKHTAEFTVFAAAAALIHIALFASAPESGARSSGAGGDALVSIQAASTEVARMVEAWERPPQAIEQIETATAEPPLQAAAPALPQIDAPQAPRAAVRLAMTEPAAADNLQIDTAAPPPPPPPKAQTPSKPQEREVPPRNANSSRNAAGQAGQQAADSGGGAQAGQSGGAQTATASSGREAKLRSVWGNKIRARIERRKRYPSAARGQARVVVRLIVSRSGQLLDYRIAKSSGISAFDQAALAAVSRAGKFPPAPKKLQASQIRLSLPISFTK